MGLHLAMESKAWLSFLLLLAMSSAQNNNYQTFDWRPIQVPRHTSLNPYSDDTTTTSYDSRYYNQPDPYSGTTGYYPDNSGAYSIDSGPYSDSFSSDYSKSAPIRYPDDSASYEQFGYPKEDNFNITVERYGGFGGTGDTRGYGAYDFPKRVHDVPQDLHVDEPKVGTEFPDLLRLGRSRTIFHRRNPMHPHPLPPPL